MFISESLRKFTCCELCDNCFSKTASCRVPKSSFLEKMRWNS